MNTIKITVHENEEQDIVSLREKLTNNGFKLNDNFEAFLIPIQGTVIKKERKEHFVTIIQEFF